MIRQSNVVEIYGDDAVVLCKNCPTIFVVSRFVNKDFGRVCPNCGLCNAALSKDREFVTFTEVLVSSLSSVDKD